MEEMQSIFSAPTNVIGLYGFQNHKSNNMSIVGNCKNEEKKLRKKKIKCNHYLRDSSC